MVVGYRVDRAIGVTRMVDEASRPPEMQAITNVFGPSILLGEFVESHEVDIPIRCVRFSPAICFIVGDYFSTISVDELASLKILGAAES